MDTDVTIEEYVQALEIQLVNMNRQLTLQALQIKKLEQELNGGGNESSNGRGDEEDAGIARRPEQNGAVVAG